MKITASEHATLANEPDRSFGNDKKGQKSKLMGLSSQLNIEI
jgi:hypothetical protein